MCTMDPAVKPDTALYNPNYDYSTTHYGATQQSTERRTVVYQQQFEALERVYVQDMLQNDFFPERGLLKVASLMFALVFLVCAIAVALIVVGAPAHLVAPFPAAFFVLLQIALVYLIFKRNVFLVRTVYIMSMVGNFVAMFGLFVANTIALVNPCGDNTTSCQAAKYALLNGALMVAGPLFTMSCLAIIVLLRGGLYKTMEKHGYQPRSPWRN